MIYLDTILQSIMNQQLHQSLPYKDSNTLKSLADLLVSSYYITENQSNLLLRILKEHNDILNIDDNILDFPIWKHPFRVLENIKKMYIEDNKIVIECPYSKQIKKDLTKLTKQLENLFQNDKFSTVDLTESNIVVLIEELAEHDIEVSEQLQSYYDTIKSWNATDIINQYQLENITYNNFQKNIIEDLGINTPLNKNLLADRSKRYQYYISDQPTGTSLTEKIAYRDQSRIWIDRNEYSIDEVIASLVELRRTPILLVFGCSDSKRLVSDLKDFASALMTHGINDQVGIYFRLPNSDDTNKEFNLLISENKYNTELSNTTQVVGIQATKIPKFFIKNNWRPMSIISIDTSMTNNKVAAYANCCDLILTYTKEKPMIETRRLWG